PMADPEGDEAGVAVSKAAKLNKFAASAVNKSVQTWFATAILGQIIFVFYVIAFYGGAGLKGDFEAWNKVLPHGYVPGDTLGNIAVAMHLVLAVTIILGGAIQFIPWIRKHFPKFHRWNGRIYMVTAFVLSIGGIYMVIARGTVGDGGVSISINAGLIMLCAFMAWRLAIKRDFARHREWAIRLFLVVSGVWFFRIYLMFWLMINQGPVGFDPKTFTGPFLTFLQYGQYIIPLLLAQAYFHVQKNSSPAKQFTFSASILVVTLITGVGIFAATMGMWLPRVS
ncbi:MAG: DUF2306 domain-containing protein, partial [Kangiellaceae bacterium]|nr:DUF2306 domain-containing protein [Kangiellaceae bacterium]